MLTSLQAMRIPPSEASWHPSSSGADPKGRLFEWRGSLYRAVLPNHTPTCEWLVSSPAGERLLTRGLLVETEATPFTLDGYGMVLRHRRIPFVSYPFEWCDAMLKDAALRLLDLNDELVRAGYITKDPSAWNLLFDGSSAVYVDISNIWPLDEIPHLFGPWPEWFARFFLYPLKLMARGHVRIARSLLRDYEHGIEKHDYERFVGAPGEMLARGVRRATDSVQGWVRSLLPDRRHLPATSVARSTPGNPSPSQWLDTLQRLRREIVSVPCGGRPSTPSQNHYISHSPGPQMDGLGATYGPVCALLERLHPSTVVEIGGSTEPFSEQAARRGATVAVLDLDERAVSNFYQRIRDAKLAILPIVQDLKDPSPTYGLCNRRIRSAPERFGADLVLALDLADHLAIRQSMDFDEIVESLDLFARRWLLVEFADHTDSDLQEVYRGHVPFWYTLAGFRDALSRRFRILEESSHSTRVLLLCQKGGSPS